MNHLRSPEAVLRDHGGVRQGAAEKPSGSDYQIAPPQRSQDGSNAGKGRLQLVNPVELHGLAVPERRWIVQDWMPAGHATLSYGAGGVGKTLIAQQLMASCATGKPWCGLAVERCKTFGHFCEDDADELHRRQDAICEAYGVSFADLEDMRWSTGVGEDNLLVVFDVDGRMKLTERFIDIVEQAKNFGARLIVLDTAADVFGGNENDRAQVRQFIGNALNRLAQDIDGAVLLNAHPSRSGLSATGDLDGGSTAWSNSARSRWSLTRPKGEEGEQIDPDERILSRRKANYASTGDDIKLRWVRGVLVPAERPGLSGLSEELQRQECERVFLDLLARSDDSNMRVSQSKNAVNYAPKVFSKRPDRQGFSRADFEQAMFSLLSKQLLTLEVYGRVGDARQRLVAVAAAAGQA